jgi:hypothetical protein
MIVAFLITTAESGRRRYVDGYCGRSALELSVARADAGVCAAGPAALGAVVGRVVAVAQAAAPSESRTATRMEPPVT